MLSVRCMPSEQTLQQQGESTIVSCLLIFSAAKLQKNFQFLRVIEYALKHIFETSVTNVYIFNILRRIKTSQQPFRNVSKNRIETFYLQISIFFITFAAKSDILENKHR